MSNLISIIYASSAVTLFSEAELIDLLKTSRDNNAADDITGMLLYKDGNFVQIIEGPEEAINRLYQKILEDPRHHQIMQLSQHPISERLFPEWSMAFRDFAHLTPQELAGFSSFLKEEFTPEHFHQNPTLAYKVLLNFKHYM